MKNLGQNFDSFLKEENLEIKPNIVFLREKFNNRLHIEEISYGAFAPIRVNIKGYLPKEQAEKIFYNIIPMCHIWTYKQDKRIKQFKYVWRQESEDEKCTINLLKVVVSR